MLNALVFAQYLLTKLRSDDRGATAVEYGLIVALIAAALVAVATLLGSQISTMLGQIGTVISQHP
jgi:pilus assembly protein Flp/PilA